MSKNINLQKRLDSFLDTLSQDKMNQIARLFSAGIPVPRIAEILGISSIRLSEWIEGSITGDKRYSELREKIFEGIVNNELSLINNMKALSSPNTVYKTMKTSYDENGKVLSKDIIETQYKPDYRAIAYLLKLQSQIYRDNDESGQSVNVNINQNVQTVVQLPSNGRIVDAPKSEDD